MKPPKRVYAEARAWGRWFCAYRTKREAGENHYESVEYTRVEKPAKAKRKAARK